MCGTDPIKGNMTLWERIGIDAKNSATASTLIKEAMVADVIRLHDTNALPKKPDATCRSGPEFACWVLDGRCG